MPLMPVAKFQGIRKVKFLRIFQRNRKSVFLFMNATSVAVFVKARSHERFFAAIFSS